jgi:tripartite-type tricarboxylate transporter receptor subunit TctC
MSVIEAQLGRDDARRVFDMSIEALDLMRQRIAAQGGEVVASSPAEFTAFIRREIERYGKVVKESGIVAE